MKTFGTTQGRKTIAFFIFTFFCTILFPQIAHAKEEEKSAWRYFFKPKPIMQFGESASAEWLFKPTIQIPALKLTKSIRTDAIADATLFASAGGGITYQRTIQKNNQNYSTFSVSLIALLMGDTSKTGEVLDFSVAGTLGFLNNIIQVGLGFDLGKVPAERGRLFFLLSAGINLTNN